MSYSYEKMSHLNERHTRVEQALSLGITRPTLNKWLVKYKQEKYYRENNKLYLELRDAIQSKFGVSPKNFIKQISSDLYICSIKRL